MLAHPAPLEPCRVPGKHVLGLGTRPEFVDLPDLTASGPGEDEDEQDRAAVGAEEEPALLELGPGPVALLGGELLEVRPRDPREALGQRGGSGTPCSTRRADSGSTP